MFNIFSKNNDAETVKSQRETIKSQDRKILNLENRIADFDIEQGKRDFLAKQNYANMQSYYETEIARLNREVEVTKANADTDVADRCADLEIKFAKREAILDKQHADRMKKLEADYVAKLAKVDRNLEADKIAYRKHVRADHNRTVEALEKENATLSKINAVSTAEATANKALAATLEDQVKSLTVTMDKLICCMPEISASFTTPNIPNVDVCQSVGGKNGK